MNFHQPILVVDDEAHILELISYNLKASGYTVQTALSGEEALESLEAVQPALILLDLMLPGIDGLEVCRRVKDDPRTAGVPIIMLTARGDEVDKVLGLELGADDYITKPFSVRELIARVKSLLRRAQPTAQAGEAQAVLLRSGALSLDVDNYVATLYGKKIQFTLKEFELLKTLMQSRGKVLSREFLLDRIWGYEYFGETRTVDVHIRHVRQKLGDHAASIETVRGVGYRFNDAPNP